jgi:hypothetical protein
MATTTRLTIKELAEGLGMDRSNLNKLIKKLKLSPKKVRGKMNQWTQIFGTPEIETILAYRDGIPHGLERKSDGTYILKGDHNAQH